MERYFELNYYMKLIDIGIGIIGITIMVIIKLLGEKFFKVNTRKKKIK